MSDKPRSANAADPKHHRPIRSFVRREGRLTSAQERALDELWPRFGIDNDTSLLDFDALFGRSAPRVLEIGFGNGELLAELAATHPDHDYLGLEVHRPGVGHLLIAAGRAGLTNVRVICDDAMEVLRHRLPAGSLDAVLLLFPDPWPKKRHHKRRIVGPEFLSLVAAALRPGGRLHLATDWQNYAEHMFEALSRCPDFRNSVAGDDYTTGAVERPDSRPVTKYENRGQRLGHEVWDYVFVRQP